ncbi:fumarylacetoacetate hydrolase family protein [Pseudidiomarina taiwanensis]|uniref:Fumarylacetoacetate hydrolase n=1 Tax=Pseudidiomarina taiwanensis TaxID=337250 RepID=A0A432ZNY8_9GAMM|nr:fumarylacetoacetate hydrolase family protein [Pseudidiomarina taiwanensis]RUO79571.1 fumarylacetoacetate hydrolase [Pseudidiomarina taiwanensis]
MQPVAPSKIVCVGRNYAAHASELNNPLPERPILFMKPPSSLTSFSDIRLPVGRTDCHHELEIALRIARDCRQIEADTALDYVDAITLALDLTLRDLQAELKNKGQPWERAKAFDGACVVGEWIERRQLDLSQPLRFQLAVNGQLRQQGNSQDMLFPMAELISDISKAFSLQRGDIILTGTPAGVAALLPGDQVCAELSQAHQHWSFSGQVYG